MEHPHGGINSECQNGHHTIHHRLGACSERQDGDELDVHLETFSSQWGR